MERVKTFVNGGREYPADLNEIQDRAAELLEGTAAALPGSHFAGRYYRATDTKDLYLDNGAAWEKIAGKEAIKEANLGPESVSVAKIKAEAVTDAKVVKGRALVETENKYGALVSRSLGTSYQPSLTRTAVVILNLGFTSTVTLDPFIITVGGVIIGEVRGNNTPENLVIPFTFICPPTVSYVVNSTAGGAARNVESSYLLL